MPTRFPGGINNVTPNTPLENLAFPNPVLTGRVVMAGNDWTDPVATSPTAWTATTVGTGARTFGNTNASYGTINMANSGADNDSIYIQSKWRVAYADDSRRIIYSARLLQSSTTADVIAGVTNTTTTPIGTAGSEPNGTTDGLYFLKVSGETTWRFYVRSGSATVASAIGIGPASASNTLRTYSFEYDPTTRKVKVWIDNTQVAGLTIPVGSFPAADMYSQMGVQNGDGNARTVSVEYLLISQDR